MFGHHNKTYGIFFSIIDSLVDNLSHLQPWAISLIIVWVKFEYEGIYTFFTIGDKHLSMKNEVCMCNIPMEQK